MTDETTALLVRARGFIERGWCKGVPARDRNGKPIGGASKRAVAWCAYGALTAAGVPPGFLFNHPANRRLTAVMGKPIPYFNDRQESAEPVLAAFDRAIAAG